MSVSVGGRTPFAAPNRTLIEVEPSAGFRLFRYWTTVQLDYWL